MDPVCQSGISEAKEPGSDRREADRARKQRQLERKRGGLIVFRITVNEVALGEWLVAAAMATRS